MLEESRMVSLAASEQVALVQYSVNLSPDCVHALVLEVYEEASLDDASTARLLLAVAKCNVVVSKATGQPKFSPIAIEIDESVLGQKRTRPDDENETPKTVKKKPANRQADVLKCVMEKPVTERAILEQCGDNRYTREILRRLMALESVERMGKGGANDPFRYGYVCSPEEALEAGKVDLTVNMRMKRIADKILALLVQCPSFVNEKEIRATVGDNTGTGKALRHLVKTLRVTRIGRGGVADPYKYWVQEHTSACLSAHPSAPSDSHHLSDCSTPTIVSNKSSIANSPDGDEVHTDEETEVAHTLALLATCSSSRASMSEESKRDMPSIYDMYIVAAAALDDVASLNV